MEYIYEARDIIPKLTCQKMIEEFENNPTRHTGTFGSTVKGSNLMIKNTIDATLPKESPTWDILDKYIYSTMGNYFQHLYNNAFHENHIILNQYFGQDINSTGYRFQKYDVGGHYSWHTDEDHARTRLFGYIIYLNDLDDDCGGCTEFKNGRKIKPETGKIAFFPSTWTYPHRGQVVQKGVKYIITGFIIRNLPLEYHNTIVENAKCGNFGLPGLKG